MKVNETPRTTGPTQGDFTEPSAPTGRWQSKARLGAVTNGVVLGTPIVLASIAGLLAARMLPRPQAIWWIAWIVAVVTTSQVTLRVTERLVRRLLPLGSLMQMSLVFPDEAPSRFSMALRAGNVEKLRRTTAEAIEKGLPSDLSQAAETALAMVAQLNRHDRGTRGHSERVRAFSEVLAEELGCSAEFRDRLRWGALLHDMGKLTVPAEILNKPGKPTAEEWVVLSGHPGEGARILAPLADWLGDAVHAAGQHHERWDGKGYPNGLAGEEIALSARIVSVADAFAVMTGARSYKKPLPMVKARQELTKNAGTQFDPVIVRAMLNVSIRRINGAAGPLSALANVPFIGTLIAGAPALPAAIGSGAVAVAMTSAGIMAPAISPVEWILPSSQVAPTELAFEPPVEAETKPQTSAARPGKEALSFEVGETKSVDQLPVVPTPTNPFPSSPEVPLNSPNPTALAGSRERTTTVIGLEPVPRVLTEQTVADQPPPPIPGTITQSTQPPTPTNGPTSTDAPATKPPSPKFTTTTATTVATTAATTTVESSETIASTITQVTFPTSETSPPIIATTTTTIDPQSTKAPPGTKVPPVTKPTTTQLPPPPPTKPWVTDPGTLPPVLTE